MKTVNLQGLSLAALIARINKAPDFGWDDEGAEMVRRGVRFKWVFNKYGKEVVELIKA